MKLLVYSAKDFEIPFLNRANEGRHKIQYTAQALDSHTALQAVGYRAISIFSGDDGSLLVLEKLWDLGVRYITIRSAGTNNIQIKAAKRLGFKVANAPDYSPHAIAEHAVGLLLTLIRKIHVADKQVHEYNFRQDNLIGFNLHGKTVGIIGTGHIGTVMVKIMRGFGCKILANDLIPSDSLMELGGVTYTDIETLCSESDIISIHIPLTYENYYFINKERMQLMKPDVVLINTARGGVIHTKALIESLEQKKILGYAADVYEKERGIFFRDNSKTGIADKQLKKLLSFPNVLLTPHHAFVTKEALNNIAKITLENIDQWARGEACKNELGYETLIS